MSIDSWRLGLEFDTEHLILPILPVESSYGYHKGALGASCFLILDNLALKNTQSKDGEYALS